MEDYGEEKKSKFNAALSQFYRIDNIRQRAEHSRRRGNLIQYNWDLDSWWAELASDAKPQDHKRYYEFSKMIIKCRKSKSVLYQVLLKKEIWLGTIQNSQGKGTAYIDPDEDLLEE